ncbi:MAG: hypothetical protein ABFC96_13450 [Thermoguttaceae bacterium]
MTAEQQFTLDDLSAKSYDELDALYRSGTVPSDLAVLDQRPKGRMLAVRGLDKTPLAGLLRIASKLPVFPWDGKTLTADDNQSGSGINRIQLGASMDWFGFKTRVQKSVFDGNDTIVLDYEQPGNPWFIRQIHDELREISPGVFLGPAMWKRSESGPVNVLWFALSVSGS